MAETSGAVAIITALALVAICGAGALAIDLGHLASVKNELQIAAEAGALGGARALCTQIPGSSSFVDIPNWANGNTTANYTFKKNAADGTLLANADIQTGFWNLAWNWSTAPKNATGAIQLLPQGTAANPLYVPAVRVKIDKNTGVNNGKVLFSLARVMGITAASASTQTVAAVFPQKGKGIYSVPAQSCLPFATPLKWVQDHWNDDPPTSFRIGSTYHSDDGGEWTSFLIDANNVPTIHNLIENGNPAPMKVGDNIYIQPGTKSVLYTDLAVDIGKTGLLPIVADNFDTNAATPIVAFVAFQLEDTGGSGESCYVQGHFVKGYVDYDGTPGGTYYFGASAGTPALVR
jgi:Flp pilus assembly protein TadG